MPYLASSLNCQGNALVNVVVEQLPTAPVSPYEGQIYIDSTLNLFRYYVSGSWRDVALGSDVERALRNFAEMQVYKAPVRLATTTALPACTYDNIDGLLTAVDPGSLIVDGIVVNVADRILVKNQDNFNENGIYRVVEVGDAATPWQLQRAEDANVPEKLRPGTMVTVQEGTTQSALSYVMVNPSFSEFLAVPGPTSNILWAVVNERLHLRPGYGIRFDGNEVHFDASRLLNGGTAAQPVYAFGPDAATGMYSDTPGTVSWSLAGIESMRLDSTFGLSLFGTLSVRANALELGTPLAATYGGTGLTSYVPGSLLYADTSTTLQALPPASPGYVLKVDASGQPTWAKAKHVEVITADSLVPVNHGLGTEDVLVVVRNPITRRFELATCEVVDDNTINLVFDSNLGQQYVVVVVGI